MNKVLAISGHDPSAGAGMLADIKVFHQFGVQGYGATTAITFQNEHQFMGINWLTLEDIISQIRSVGGASIGAVKIGILPSMGYLLRLTETVKETFGDIPIIWDPVITSSTGYRFMEVFDEPQLDAVLTNLFVMTPNFSELQQLLEVSPDIMTKCDVIVKGEISPKNHSVDTLYRVGMSPISLSNPRLDNTDKHGTGCAYSSAIASCIAQGHNLVEAFQQANDYVFELLNTGEKKESFHHEIAWKDD